MLKSARYPIHRADTVVLHEKIATAVETPNLLIQDHSKHFFIQHRCMG